MVCHCRLSGQHTFCCSKLEVQGKPCTAKEDADHDAKTAARKQTPQYDQHQAHLCLFDNCCLCECHTTVNMNLALSQTSQQRNVNVHRSTIRTYQTIYGHSTRVRKKQTCQTYQMGVWTQVSNCRMWQSSAD